MFSYQEHVHTLRILGYSMLRSLQSALDEDGLQPMAQQKPRPTPAPNRKPPASSRRLLDQRTMVIVFVFVCLLALLVFAIRSSFRSPTAPIGRADAANAELVAQGRQLYTTRCAGCHGADLKGEPGWPQPRPNGAMPASPLDQSGPARQRDDAWIFTTVKLGGQASASPGSASSMPAFGSGLTDAQIWAIISYIESTWTDRPAR
jgi:mono/diheme cytochrome c family protein